jgi:hypothetical protein
MIIVSKKAPGTGCVIVLIPKAVADLRQIGLALGNRGVRLATLGYVGHMWELFAIGPVIGIWAMLRLKSSPESVKIGGGRG